MEEKRLLMLDEPGLCGEEGVGWESVGVRDVVGREPWDSGMVKEDLVACVAGASRRFPDSMTLPRDRLLAVATGGAVESDAGSGEGSW